MKININIKMKINININMKINININTKINIKNDHLQQSDWVIISLKNITCCLFERGIPSYHSIYVESTLALINNEAGG